jgi:hypothetical protein
MHCVEHSTNAILNYTTLYYTQYSARVYDDYQFIVLCYTMLYIVVVSFCLSVLIVCNTYIHILNDLNLNT